MGRSAPEAPQGPEYVTLRGPSAAVVKNMNASLELPTATSVRAVPVKLLFDNRIVINNHLKRARGGKISFTHLIGYAMVQALKAMPSMNHSYAEMDGKPTLVKPEHVNLGLAIDLVKATATASSSSPASRRPRRSTSSSSGRRTRRSSARPGPTS